MCVWVVVFMLWLVFCIEMWRKFFDLVVVVLGVKIDWWILVVLMVRLLFLGMVLWVFFRSFWMVCVNWMGLRVSFVLVVL